MAAFDNIKKLAFLYRSAAFLSIASREDVRVALGYLIDILPPEQMQAIQEHYIDAADSNVPQEERQEALNKLDALTDSILEQYSEDDRIQTIYDNLDVINTNAEEEFGGTAEDAFKESIEQARESVDYQEGQELANSGGASVSQDPEKRKEYFRQYQHEKRHNPVFREKYLARKRELDKARYSKEQDLLKKRIQRSISGLMDLGLSKEQATKKFNEDIQSAVTDRIQSTDMTKEEAAQALSQIKSEEIAKYLQGLTSKRQESRVALTPAERKKKSRLAKAYAEKVLSSNPETDINALKTKVKSMSIEELQEALQNLAA